MKKRVFFLISHKVSNFRSKNIRFLYAVSGYKGLSDYFIKNMQYRKTPHIYTLKSKIE